ncbi:RodZ domain-containing protein [Microbulbifer hydrolyticus]|uniref:Cytoskeleton protein RodZ n=1 Tax=Microbulbifer hydrolyticus TaxID=48074 RepID=A0A6P1TDR0_9GAMM|nr:RodZ domain-containing protein [Microbulbifer hydrolyticus]MBB5212132.1 cytoskeleton protein RodZ [Microbulbifer hydrolyticus]QHQ39805.1 DUF4115 domain-containing protein [Microbulbifer hydrolyticus]
MSSSNQNTEQSEATAVQDQAASVGALLLEARQKAGLTSAELAGRLCMTPDKLEALERDEFDRFPGATYVRGYIRNICKELGADEAPALAAYAKQVPADSTPRVPQMPKGSVVGGSTGSSSGAAFRPLLLLVVAAAVGGYWWFQGNGGQHLAQVERVTDPQQLPAGTETAAEPVEDQLSGQMFAASAADVSESEVAEDFEPQTDAELGEFASSAIESADLESAAEAVETVSEAPAQPVVEPVQVAQEPAQVAAEPEVPAQTAVSQPRNEPEPIVEPQAPAESASGAALALTFSEESWVEVTDATGSKILARLQPAGSTVEVSGEAPFSLMLGNAAATTVSYAGEEVESAPLGNRRTRKLVVGG